MNGKNYTPTELHLARQYARLEERLDETFNQVEEATEDLRPSMRRAMQTRIDTVGAKLRDLRAELVLACASHTRAHEVVQYAYVRIAAERCSAERGPRPW